MHILIYSHPERDKIQNVTHKKNKATFSTALKSLWSLCCCQKRNRGASNGLRIKKFRVRNLKVSARRAAARAPFATQTEFC